MNCRATGRARSRYDERNFTEEGGRPSSDSAVGSATPVIFKRFKVADRGPRRVVSRSIVVRLRVRVDSDGNGWMPEGEGRRSTLEIDLPRLRYRAEII